MAEVISCLIDLRWMPLDLTDDKSTSVQKMAWCRQATSHYLSQCWPRFMSPYGVTRSQWVKLTVVKRCHINSLVQDSSNSSVLAMELLQSCTKLSIWWNISGSKFAQVTACCLTAPIHYLNQCWFIIKGVLWHSLGSNFRSANRP